MSRVQEPDNQASEFAHPFLRARNALVEWSAHTLVVAGLLIGFWVIEQLLHALWGEPERMLFGHVPFHWIFDAADVAILGGFLGYGTISVIRAYRGSSREIEK